MIALGRQGSMMARASQRADAAATIIHDAIAMGNLNEEDFRQTVEYALTRIDALVPPPTSDDTRTIAEKWLESCGSNFGRV
jgi:hypothetical protein